MNSWFSKNALKRQIQYNQRLVLVRTSIYIHCYSINRTKPPGIQVTYEWFVFRDTFLKIYRHLIYGQMNISLPLWKSAVWLCVESLISWKCLSSVDLAESLTPSTGQSLQRAHVLRRLSARGTLTFCLVLWPRQPFAVSNWNEFTVRRTVRETVKRGRLCLGHTATTCCARPFH